MGDKDHFDKLSSFMAQQGMVWGPEPEIYGGLAGFYTYGPVGKLLKNNVEKAIRDVFVKNEFFEVEAPTIMPKEVWKASGHLDGFTDPMVKCQKCKSDFKEDSLEEDKCPNCGGELKKAEDHDLMMKTTIGLDQEAYNRPETATTTYLPFRRYDHFFRGKYPFGVFQIGKAYRNEISPRQSLLRVREFTQAEGQLMILPDEKDSFEKYEEVKDKKLPMWTWKLQDENKKPEQMKLSDAVKKKLLGSRAYAWTLSLAYELFVNMGIPEENIRMRQHGPDEKAFYAADAWDVEVNTKSFGWVEMCGVHDRTDYDLKQHAEHSGQNLDTNQDSGKVVPHILEIAFGTDRPTFALMDLFYDYQEEDEGKTTFRIPYELAPIKVAVLPLMRKDELQDKAREVYEKLNCCYQTIYDETASIGKRYLRASQKGIPWCVTVDYDSLEDDSVTVRDRNSEEQVRVKISELVDVLYKLYQGAGMKEVGELV